MLLVLLTATGTPPLATPKPHSSASRRGCRNRPIQCLTLLSEPLQKNLYAQFRKAYAPNLNLLVLLLAALPAAAAPAAPACSLLLLLLPPLLLLPFVLLLLLTATGTPPLATPKPHSSASRRGCRNRPIQCLTLLSEPLQKNLCAQFRKTYAPNLNLLVLLLAALPAAAAPACSFLLPLLPPLLLLPFVLLLLLTAFGTPPLATPKPHSSANRRGCRNRPIQRLTLLLEPLQKNLCAQFKLAGAAAGCCCCCCCSCLLTSDAGCCYCCCCCCRCRRCCCCCGCTWLAFLG